MAYETILYEVREPHIGWLTLNRPERLNAATRQMHDEMVDCLNKANFDDNVRVVVITGAGRGFCAGADVSGGGAANADRPAPSIDDRRNGMRYGQQQPVRLIRRMDKPVIAMVNGVAVGHGFDLALSCDVRIGSPSARFQVAYIKRGLIPGSAGCYLMPQVMGLPKTMELIMTGDFMESEDALKFNVLNKLVPADQLEAEAMEMAKKMAENPPISLRLCKMLVYKGFEMNLDLMMEWTATALTIASGSEDAKEGARAFMEKRAPVFQGR